MIFLTKIDNIIFAKAHFISNINKSYGVVIPERFRPKTTIQITGQVYGKDYHSTASFFITPNGEIRHSNEKSNNFVSEALAIYKI